MLGQALYQGAKVMIIKDCIVNCGMECLITRGMPDDLQWVKLSDLDQVVWFINVRKVA